jgi:hypothetical protein
VQRPSASQLSQPDALPQNGGVRPRYGYAGPQQGRGGRRRQEATASEPSSSSFAPSCSLPRRAPAGAGEDDIDGSSMIPARWNRPSPTRSSWPSPEGSALGSAARVLVVQGLGGVGAGGAGPRRRPVWPPLGAEPTRPARGASELRARRAGAGNVREGTGEVLPGQVLGHVAATGTRWEEWVAGRP